MTMSDSLFSIKVLTFAFVTCVLAGHSRAQNFASYDAYAAYGHYSLGSARVLGLGGAYTAISTDANAFFYNPAGPALSETKLQFEASTNRLNNDELDINSDGYSQVIANQFEIIAINYSIGRLSIGMGYLMPYFSQIKLVQGPESHASLKIQDVAANLSYALNKNLSLGFNVKQSRSIQTEISETIDKTAIGETLYFQWGVMFQKNRFAFGYSFSPEVNWKIKSESGTSVSYTSFMDVAAPQRETFGVSYFVKPDKIRVVVDMIKTKKLQETIAFESAYSPFRENVQPEDVTLPKYGIEFLLIQTNKTSAQFRLGYYSEPSRFESISARRHITIGFEMRFGPALLQIALDQAEKFNNNSQALSIIWDKL